MLPLYEKYGCFYREQGAPVRNWNGSSDHTDRFKLLGTWELPYFCVRRVSVVIIQTDLADLTVIICLKIIGTRITEHSGRVLRIIRNLPVGHNTAFWDIHGS